jgi:hypothetical protein
LLQAGEKGMKTIQEQKRRIARCVAVAALGVLLFAASAFPQCNMNENGYVFLHPAFANKNWGKAWYDSISIILPDTLCASKPVHYDICGPAASAVAVYSNSTDELYLMKTQYRCPPVKPPCTYCILQYLDPSQIALSGIALAQNSPLYLVKSPLYGGDSVKVLVKNTQKKVVALALSTTSLATLHVDTLATSALLPSQDIVRIQGAYDSVNQRDTGVWLLGSAGLMRYFPIANGQWGTETKRDITGVSDTVYCVNNGFAGTSTGSIYRRLGGAFVFDNQSVTAAITNIYGRGAVGNGGVFLDYTGTRWVPYSFGSGNYRYGNFINRWDGYGIELLDDQWRRSAYTYRQNPSSISATVPSGLMFYINNNAYSYNGFATENYTLILKDPDASFTDFGIVLNNAGTKVNMKNDGKYTITAIPPDSQCTIDSLRLKSGSIGITLSSASVQVTATCELGKRDGSCSVARCMRVDYPFLATHAWKQGDVLTISAGGDTLRIVFNTLVTASSGFAFSPTGPGSVSFKIAGRTIMFFVQQGLAKKLVNIGLYNVAGQTLASLVVGNQAVIAAPRIACAGVLYARYRFSDGSSACRPLVLVR